MLRSSSNLRDTLTISAWNLLGLVQDISRAQSHFLALTLVRTDSSNPRTMYTLGEAAALPFSELEVLYTNRANFADSSRMSPKMVLAQDAADRKRSGGLGSVMVVSVELPNGDTKSPRDALKEVCRSLLQKSLTNLYFRSWWFTCSSLWVSSMCTRIVCLVWFVVYGDTLSKITDIIGTAISSEGILYQMS